MFTAIELTNFKSFGHIRFDFKGKGKKYKDFVAVYGENGSGKSNFVSAIALLPRLLLSLSDTFQLKILKKYLEDNKKIGQITDLQDMINAYDSLSLNLGKYRTLECDERTVVRYEFLINNIQGYYEVAFREEIEHEELYYMGSRQRGILYSVNKHEYSIDSKINSYAIYGNYREVIEDKIHQYWGKHSLLAILQDEIQEKNKEYIEKSLSIHLLQVLLAFRDMYVQCRETKYIGYGYGCNSKLNVRNFESIEISRDCVSDMEKLKHVEKIINDFYTQTYSDIVSVFYRLAETNDDNSETLRYNLFLRKIIAGKVREIPFSEESAGTQSVLTVLRAVIEVINGRTVIYDEIDEGIHDLLMTNILNSIQDDLGGQFIITTHNTTLLETISSDKAYVIYCDDNGNKDARCISDYGFRIQKTHNMRNLYLKGVFGGVPYSSQIDYSTMHLDSMDGSEE